MALLEAGANVNIEGNQSYPTAVHGAIKAENLSILRLLVEKSADIGISNGAHGSPVEYASRQGDFSICAIYSNKEPISSPLAKENTTTLCKPLA